MTSPHPHPIRDAEIHSFQRIRQQPDERKGVEWVALFHPYDTYPVVSRASTREKAERKLEDMRTEAIEKHERVYQARMENAEKLKQYRKNKKEKTA